MHYLIFTYISIQCHCDTLTKFVKCMMKYATIEIDKHMLNYSLIIDNKSWHTNIMTNIFMNT